MSVCPALCWSTFRTIRTQSILLSILHATCNNNTSRQKLGVWNHHHCPWKKVLFLTCTSCVWYHHRATAECPCTVLNMYEAGPCAQEMWAVPLSKPEQFVSLHSLALATPPGQSVVNANYYMFLQHATNDRWICCSWLTIVNKDPLNISHCVLMYIALEKLKMQCPTLALCGHGVIYGQKCLRWMGIMCSFDLCSRTVTGSMHLRALLTVLYKTEITLIMKIATSKSRYSLRWKVQHVLY